jgi:hypothetical protein
MTLIIKSISLEQMAGLIELLPDNLDSIYNVLFGEPPAYNRDQKKVIIRAVSIESDNHELMSRIIDYLNRHGIS